MAPVLVFAGYLMGKPMDLHFTAFEIVAIVLAVTIVSRQTSDGESHWMEGVMLIAVYLMLAIGFFSSAGIRGTTRHTGSLNSLVGYSSSARRIAPPTSHLMNSFSFSSDWTRFTRSVGEGGCAAGASTVLSLSLGRLRGAGEPVLTVAGSTDCALSAAADSLVLRVVRSGTRVSSGFSPIVFRLAI